MEHQIIHSIFEVTRARDTDSLEKSLLEMLADLLPVTRVSLFRLVNEFRFDTCKQTLALIVHDRDNPAAIRWEIEAIDFEPTPAMIDAANHGTIQVERDADLHRIHVPVPGESRADCMIILETADEIAIGQDQLLTGIAGIYSNFLRVLDDSQRDKLTGLLNRRTFDKRLTRMMDLQREVSSNQEDTPNERRHRGGASAWLAIIDIDHFKRVNDSHGHIYGDEVILNLGQQMKRFFRNTDLLFRFGGEEFLVVLEPMHGEQAGRALERFRSAVESQTFPQIGGITVSVGYASIRSDDYPPVVLDRADKALYFAKRNGRNQVANYEHLVQRGEVSATAQRGTIDLF